MVAKKLPVERRESANIERHIQTILISIVTGSIVFAATYFFNDKSDKAVLNTQLAALTAQVVELRAEVRTMQGNFASKEITADHETRLRILEQRLHVRR